MKLLLLSVMMVPCAVAYHHIGSMRNVRMAAATTATPAVTGGRTNGALTANPVIIFPAQFGTKDDYVEMVEELAVRGHPAVPLELGRLEWLKIARATVTREYWRATLEPVPSLNFYFERAKEAVEKVKAQYPGRKIHIVGHSIGGWIARAFLGEVAAPEDVRDTFVSLTTLGTPHYPPTTPGVMANFEQTRGLLKYVNDRFPGAYHKNIKYVSVCGVTKAGRLRLSNGELLNSLEEAIAYISYLPLCGNGEATGDGIVPESVAILEGSVPVRVSGVRHSNFIPTASKSLRIEGPWYGTPDVVDQWIIHLPEKQKKTQFALPWGART